MHKPGTTIIQEIRRGACNDDLGDAIAAAVERVKVTGRGAKVSLTLHIKPAGLDKNAKDIEVEKCWVTDEIKSTLPKMPQHDTLLFIDEKGDLTREDPQRYIPGIKKDDLSKTA